MPRLANTFTTVKFSGNERIENSTRPGSSTLKCLTDSDVKTISSRLVEYCDTAEKKLQAEVWYVN